MPTDDVILPSSFIGDSPAGVYTKSSGIEHFTVTEDHEMTLNLRTNQSQQQHPNHVEIYSNPGYDSTDSSTSPASDAAPAPVTDRTVVSTKTQPVSSLTSLRSASAAAVNKPTRS